MNYIPLSVKTNYELLSSLIKIDDLCKYLSGNFTLNGEELERMNEDNYYEPTFIPISDIEKYDILDSIKKYFTKK